MQIKLTSRNENQSLSVMPSYVSGKEGKQNTNF